MDARGAAVFKMENDVVSTMSCFNVITINRAYCSVITSLHMVAIKKAKLLHYFLDKYVGGVLELTQKQQ